MHKTRYQGLNFVPLDMNSTSMVLFTDALFANAAGIKSQLGNVILFKNNTSLYNVIYYK